MKLLPQPLLSEFPAQILLVDDDLSLLKLLALRLESAGHEVITVANAKQALATLKHTNPDLVLSDLRMDEMDGMDLMAQIQRLYPNLPVVILTAHGTIPDAVEATRQGVAGFLTKPVDKQELFSLIDHLKSHRTKSDKQFNTTTHPQVSQLMEQQELDANLDKLPELSQARAEFEKAYLIKVLNASQGRVTQAAKLAGRNRTDFYKLLHNHGLEAAIFKPQAKSNP